MCAGRLVAKDEEELVERATQHFQFSVRAASSITMNRHDRVFETCFSDLVTTRLVSTSLIAHYNTVANNRPSFFTSPQYRSLLRHHTSPSPLVPARLPPAPSPAQLRKAVFLNINERDLRRVDALGVLIPSRICPPDKCSGERRPITEKYEAVEDLLLALIGFRFNRDAIERYNIVGIRTVLPFRLAVALGSFGLTEKDRKSISLMLPDVMKMGSESEVLKNDGRGILPEQVCILKDTLFKMQGTRQPCLCDLTHLTEKLTAAVLVADFDNASARLLATNRQSVAVTTQAEIDLFVRNGHLNGKLLLFRQAGWTTKVAGFLRGIDPAVNNLLRQPATRLDIYGAWRSLIIALGADGLMELVYAVDSGDFRFDNGGVGYIAVVQDCVKVLTVDRDPAHKMADLEKQSRAAHLSGNFEAYTDSNAQILTFAPLNSIARLNSASIRLQAANDTDQNFQWSRAIYDATMAIYYGPPNFKAYYRRGLALAHLKMWKKAIADFERALKIEPKNPLLLQRLSLARNKQS